MSNKLPPLSGLRATAVLALAVTGMSLAGTSTADEHGLSAETLAELAAVRGATAAYHDIDVAFAAGYIDINVVVPGMGCHLLNPGYLDGAFSVTEPEILVYEDCTPGLGGQAKLRAVEYATLCGGPPGCTLPPPDGFSGVQDTWVPLHDAGLWTLHAWIWRHNPDHIFAPLNPRFGD
ncbi:MAG: hypothetical protein OEW35_16245 [Gammaproteobacteria bacterium]|nr:hypothetical protein [Gammaproteobacteria bacterium]